MIGGLRPFVLAHLEGFRRGGVLRRGVRVFTYHGVVERIVDRRVERNLITLDDFRQHLGFLRHRRVLGLDELAGIESTGRWPRRPAAVLTFDDGYANNLLAAELLDRFGLPWAVFVTTGGVGRCATIWTVELSLLLLRGAVTRVEVLGRVWPLGGRQERESAFREIRRVVKSQPADERQAFMDKLRGQFPAGESERLLSVFPGLRMMTWEELAQLSRSVVTVGSHGVDHEIHHARQPEAVRRAELTGSKAILEGQLGQPCRYFAFPNGDFGVTSASEVRDAGYDLAFTTVPGTVTRNADPALLPRLTASVPGRNFIRDYYWDFPVSPTADPDHRTSTRGPAEACG